MADPQPWRRRMLPPLTSLNRPRTILLQTSSFDDLQTLNRQQNTDYNSDRSEPSLQIGSESFHLSKRHSRPKFLARASQYFKNPSRHEQLNTNFEPEPPKDLDHAHMNQIIDAVFSGIVTNLGKPISAQNNEPILRVFEAYRDLKAEVEGLQNKLDKAVVHCNTTLDTLEGERRRWKEDEANFKAEIKKLELIIAHGKTGLSAVTLARQQSLIRRGLSKKVAKVEPEQGNKISHRHTCMDEHKFESLSMIRGKPKLQVPAAFTTNVARLIQCTVRGCNRSTSILIIRVQKYNQANIVFIATEPLSHSPTAILLSRSFREDSYQPLANVDTAIGSWRDSVSSSNSESSQSDLSEDFSSTGGDLLSDEVYQMTLTSQAVEHVASLIARAKGNTVERIIEILESSMKPEQTITELRFVASPKTKQESPLSLDGLTRRHAIDDLRTSTENLTPFCRPFSFFEGDDYRTMITRSTPPYRTASQTASMIPSPVLEHSMARSRREDSTSSLVTSFQRSPQITPRTPSAASSRLSSVTTVKKSSSGIQIIQTPNSMKCKGDSSESE
jgi:hypothetical protein